MLGSRNTTFRAGKSNLTTATAPDSTTRSDPKRRLADGFVVAVSLGGLAALALTAPSLPLDKLHEVVLFFALCAAAQAMPVSLFGKGTASAAFVVTFASLVYLGPSAAVWANLACGLVMAVRPRRKPLVKAAWNVGSLALSALAVGELYVALGGRVGLPLFDLAVLPPMVVAVAAYFVIYTGLQAAVIAFTSTNGFWAVWTSNFRWLAPGYVAMGLAGAAMALVVPTVGLLGVTIFFIPLAMAWYSFRLYVSRTEEERRRNGQLQLSNARLDVANARLSQRVTELAAINKIGLTLNGSLDLSNVLGEIVDSALGLFPGQAAAVALADQAAGRVQIATSVGLPAGAAELLAAPHGPLAQCVERDEVVAVADAAVGDAELAAVGVGALYCAPLRFGGAAGGVFLVTFDGAREVGADGRQLLATVAQQAATAVHNARLYQEIEQGYLSTIQAMVSVVDARERYAPGHSERVREYATACGRQMGLDARQIATLELAALFHDIGHVGVPETVLNKPGALTGEEWQLVRKHPQLGVAMLKQVPRMEAVAQVILQHHERYDGQGYPEGLLGDETHVLAQVLAVADAYEAMTSPRPHRAAFPPAKAIAELRANRGSQFAPRVVDAFVRAVAAPIAAPAPASALAPALADVLNQASV